MMRFALAALLAVAGFTPAYAALVQSTFEQNAATGTTATVTPTTTPANGNTGIIIVSQSANGTGTATSSGWSAVPGLSLVTLPSSGNFLSVLQKNLGASEPSSYTVTVNGGSISNQITLTYLEFSGRATSPFTVTPTTNTIASGAHPLSCPATGLTANAGDDLLYIVMMGNFGVPMTFTQPTGYTTAQNASGGTASQVSAATAVKTNVSAGATGTVTGSQTWSGANTDAGTILISLAQASGGSCTHDFWASGGSYAVPNGSSGSYWALSGAFATPNCSTGTYWLQSGASGST
jgi:hypothetical protein